MHARIQTGEVPGAVVGIARAGKLVYFDAFGFSDKATSQSMQTDAIFSIASMTKPIVAAAAMRLFEESQIMLGDLVSKYLPSLGAMRVAIEYGTALAGTALATEPAKSPMTLQDLLRHTSGLLYGGRSTTALHRLYPASSMAVATTMTRDEFIARLASLPLAYQPGSVWDYSLSMDVLGALIESVTGTALGAYLHESVLEPLAMKDTSYLVTGGDAHRYARALPLDPMTGQPQPMFDSTRPLKFECGGSGMVSTAGDYLRFAQMLLNGGQLDEKRILSRKTVEYMVADHLGPQIDNRIASIEPQRAGYGFGLGLAVRRQCGVASTIGSAGDYFWNGAFGTSFWVDPQEQVVGVLMMHAPGSGEIRQHYRQAVVAHTLQAIV